MTTNWSTWGVAAVTAETDFHYQGSFCISGQVKTAEVGFNYTHTATTDFHGGKVWLAKFIQTNKDAIDGLGLQLFIGLDATNHYRYEIFNSTTYPVPGGFQIVPVDPMIPGFITQIVASPNSASIDFFGIKSDANATAKAPNLGLDAIDWIPSGRGLTLTGSNGTFTNFTVFDEDITTNRYGVISTRAGILYINGTLSIGSGSATGTASFNDSNKVLVFNDGRFNRGFSGLFLNLENTGATITMSSCVLNSQGAFKGIATQSADTRANLLITGSLGGFYANACSFNNFDRFLISGSAEVILKNCTFIRPREMTQSVNPIITTCSFDNPDVQVSQSFLLSSNPNNIAYSTFISSGSGHGLEIVEPGNYSFKGNTFIGYGGTPGSNTTASSGDGNSMIYNNSGGIVTMSISAGGTTVSVRNGVNAVTVINNPKVLTLTGIISGSEVAIVSGSPPIELFNVEEVASSGSVAYSYNYEPNKVVDIIIFHTDYSPNLSNITEYTLLNSDATIPIQQILDRQYENPI